MGLILDSSVVIAAERGGDRVEQLIEKIVKATGDQEAALSAIGVTELIHGIYRAQTQEIRLRRESFLNELLADLTVFPYTKETALDLEKLVRDLTSNGKGAKQLKDADAIVVDLSPRLKERDVVLIMSNGGFGGIHEKLLAALARG